MPQHPESGILNLKTLFVVVAIVEAFYGAAGILIPPSQVHNLLGWNLSADGQWVTKLLGCALASQAALAWVLRRDPPVAVAWILGLYQIGATLTDIGIWISLADQGVFSTQLARWSVMTAIPTHFVIGVLVLIAAAQKGKDARNA